ncbi:helix-turn-helix domain-containing protein [Bacillus sp. REN16]|uniref:helix-turn-helix domain-containing protein n=1 Tax=Bacillus sp. REN16 TaxID=2887296 RepID=UPI001E461178|nr:AraC family transcriptional regulator [Bacillus sp. REN16]MCC3355949.1 AraC family transcriptional regulator [Bacillus sp. REN16]
METNIFFCGYSYHMNGYHSVHKEGFPAYLFRLQTEGSCVVVVKGQRMEQIKGNLLLLKPGDYYEIFVQEGKKSGDYHIACQGDWVDEWWCRTPKQNMYQIDLDGKLLSLWNQMIVAKRRPQSSQNDELIDYLLRALCLTMEQTMNETVPSHPYPYKVTRMMRYIEEHATTAIKVEEVAEHVRLSVSRSVHLFKESVGKTMIEYAQEVRLNSAIERMKYTTIKLEQIAEECGFGSYPYFHKVFKKKYGVSPGVYRRLEG